MDFNIFQKSEEYKERLRDEMTRALTSNTIDPTEPAGFQGPGVMMGEAAPKKNMGQYLEAATGWVYGCVTAIADAVAACDFDLYRVNGEDNIEEIENHPILDLLDRVNNYTTRYDHLSMTQQYLELVGEAPWYLSRGESGTQEPESMLLLRPDRLKVVQSVDKNSTSPIDHYEYRVDSTKTVEIKPEEIVFLRYPDPTNPFRGKGTLQAAALTVDIDNFAEEFNKRFFYNSARPDSIIGTDQKLTPSQREAIRNDIKRLYQGGEKAHKTAILESGLKWTPMSISQKDMDFLEQQKFSRDKILSIFRVHKSILALSDDVNLANAKIGEYVFAKWTVRPKMMRIAAQLNEFLLPMFAGTENMFLSFDDPVPEDKTADIQKYDSALSKGWMTPNEVRREQNLEDIGDAGDRLYIPSNYLPIEMAGTSLSPAPVRSVFPLGKKKMIIQNSGGGYKRAVHNLQYVQRQKAKKKITLRAIEKVEKKIDTFAQNLVKDMIAKKKSERIAFAKDQMNGMIKASDDFVPAYYGIMSRFFLSQKKKVLKKFPKKDINIDDYLLDEEDESKILVSLTNPLQKDIIKQAGTIAASVVGDEAFDMATRRVQQFLKENAIQFSTTVNEYTNQLIRDELAAGVAKGEGIPKLRKRLTILFDDMSKVRAERIARSEVIRASNFAAKEAYTQSGVVEKLEWLLTDDSVTCEFCRTLDAKTADLNDTFFSQGDTVHGEDGGTLKLDYSDIEYPPLHVNCRCTLIPVVT